MLWEALAAGVVGLLLVWLVLQPMLQPQRARPEVYEPPELLETRRGVALAALKEIEFDRATGKLSEADYAELHAKYTAEALAALRAEDGGEPRSAPPAASVAAHASTDVEAMIAAKVRLLRAAQGVRTAEPTAERTAEPTPAAATAAGSATSTTEPPVCRRCGPRPEPDALWCSSCGDRLGAASCTSCHAPVPADGRFCERCGTPVAA